MLIQASCIILCKHSNLLNMRIGHIAECKVNASITACDGHCAHGSLLREFLHSETVSTC